MWRGIRIFSPKRVFLSIVVGFMCPVAFMVTMAVIGVSTGTKPSHNVAILVVWPRVLWDLLVEDSRSEANRSTGLLFITICDTIVYGAIIYVILTAVSAVRPKTIVLEPPPKPEEIHPRPLNSD